MARKRKRTVTTTDVEDIRGALDHLRLAKEHLRSAGAWHAVDYTKRAIKSAEGARRHAEGRLFRQARPVLDKAGEGEEGGE